MISLTPVDERNRLRDKAEKDPDQEKIMAGCKARMSGSSSKTAKRKRGKQYTETLSSTSNTGKTWKTIKAINREREAGSNVAIIVNDKTIY